MHPRNRLKTNFSFIYCLKAAQRILSRMVIKSSAFVRSGASAERIQFSVRTNIKLGAAVKIFTGKFICSDESIVFGSALILFCSHSSKAPANQKAAPVKYQLKQCQLQCWVMQTGQQSLLNTVRPCSHQSSEGALLKAPWLQHVWLLVIRHYCRNFLCQSLWRSTDVRTGNYHYQAITQLWKHIFTNRKKKKRKQFVMTEMVSQNYHCQL